MAGLHNSIPGGAFGRLARFGLLKGLNSLEIDREEFRRQLKKKHGLEVADFRHMHLVPVARLDAIAKRLIKDTEKLAVLEGAGFGLGGMLTIIPDAGLLTILTLRLIQRLCLLYGFDQNGQSEIKQQNAPVGIRAEGQVSNGIAEEHADQKRRRRPGQPRLPWHRPRASVARQLFNVERSPTMCSC